jgi:hypothetical protein
MDLQEKIEFALGTIPRMAKYTFPYLAQFFGCKDQARGEPLGSGLFCRLSGRSVMVTALRVVLEGLGDDYAYLAVSAAGAGTKPHVISGLIRRDPSTDLAILPVPEDFPYAAELSYWPEDRIDVDLDRLSTDFLFIHGYPGVRSQNYPLPIDARVLSRTLPYGVMQRLDDLPDDLGPHQFAVDFDITRCQAEQGGPAGELFDPFKGPRGLSGSPVWRIGASGRRIAEWSPDWAQLVGILTGWNEERRVLVATRASKVLELAARDLGTTTRA